mgnify:CR=1 FL=1
MHKMEYYGIVLWKLNDAFNNAENKIFDICQYGYFLLEFNGRAMNQDLQKLTLTQIGILIKQLNKGNFAETSSQLNQVC